VQAIDDILGRSDSAQPAVAEKPAPQKQAADLQAKRAAVAEQLSLAQRTLESTEGPPPAADGLVGEVERLKRLGGLYAQQQAAASGNAELQANRVEAAKRLAELRESGIAEPPPYSFFLLDGLRDELQTLTGRAESAAATINAAADSLKDAQTAAAEAHRKRRQAAESQPPAKQPENNARPSLKSLEQDAQIADEQVKLRQAKLANAQLNEQVIDLAIELVNEKIAVVAPQVTLSDAEQQEKLAELDKEEAQLDYARTTAEERLDYLTRRASEAQRTDELSTEPEPARSAELEARQVARAAQHQTVTLLNEQLERLSQKREAWTRRFAVQRKSIPHAQLFEWAREAADTVDQLARDDRRQDREVDDYRKLLADVEKRLQSVAPDDSALRRSLNGQRRVYQELINQYGENITSIELTSRVQKRLLAEIRDDRISFGERIAQAWAFITNVWNYEIVVSEDQPVTVSMVVWGIILLVLGLLISRWASAALGRRFLPRFGVHESAAAALQSITFYTLVTLTALLALRWINVPLTLFTFLGGALAIGIGFGSQNLVNNFISGLILLAERPIRVGDVIEIDGLVGAVDSIGARSTRIRTVSNYEIIVPNSSFLERNVVNWTLSDKRVRCTIAVGLAYGSPTREVARWLKKAAEEHGQVLERPEPFVWFVNFGDNALQFELYYWIQIRAMSERRRIESDLRFIIDQYFREAGLVIAFPQRDLHISNEQPLQVALLPPQEQAASEIAKAA
jgi:small-conductance mechanosensitive channel